MSRFNNLAALKPAQSRGTAAQALPEPKTLAPRTLAPPTPLRAAPFGHSPYLPAADVNESTLTQIGFYGGLAYIFIRVGMINEVLGGLQLKPYLSYITVPVALLALLASGGWIRVLRYKPGLSFCCFMAWLLIATPFSVWRGGSAHTLFSAFEADFPVAFIIAGLTTSWRRLRLMLCAIALGAVCDTIICLRFPAMVGGRFSASFGTLSNPNDLATHLLFTLPFCVIVLLTSSRFSFWTVLLVPTIIGMLLLIVRTGSRAALLSIMALAFYLIVRGSVKLKIMAVACMCMMALSALFLLPDEVKLRYMTLLGSDDLPAANRLDTQSLLAATSSEAARKALLMNSISETIHNPLVGVGPGQFAVAEADVAKALGRETGWQVTHNSYTQVSAEAGIPAFLFFAGALFGSLGLLLRLNKRTARDPALSRFSLVAFWLIVAFIGFSVNCFFSALAYEFYVPAMVGLSIAVVGLAEAHTRVSLLRKTA